MGDEEELPEDMIKSQYPKAYRLMEAAGIQSRGIYLGLGVIRVLEIAAQKIENQDQRLYRLEENASKQQEFYRRMTNGY